MARSSKTIHHNYKRIGTKPSDFLVASNCFLSAGLARLGFAKLRQICLIRRDPLGKSEWPNGDREAAQGGHPRQEGVEGSAQETHAAGASAVHRCRPGARTRPGRGGGAPNRQRPHEQSRTGDAPGWSGRSSNCTSSSCTDACAASLSDGSIELSRYPGGHVEGSAVIARPSVVGYATGSGPPETCCSSQLRAGQWKAGPLGPGC